LNRKDTGTIKAHMVRGTVGTFALKVVTTLLAFGTSLLLARLLGAKEYGVYAYAISWAQLLAIPAVMGLNTLLVREVAKYKALEDWGSLRGILHWSDRVVLLTSIGIAAAFSLIVWLLQGKFAPEVRIALWIAMGLVPLLSFLLLRQGGLQGLGHVVEAQVPQFFLLPATFLVLTVGVYFAFGLSGSVAVGLRLIAGLIAAITVLFLLRKYLPEPVAGAPPLYRQREWLKSTLPLLFVGTAGIINQQVSTVIVGSMLGPKTAGIFDVAGKGAGLVSFALVAINMPLAPAVAGLYAQGKKEVLQRLVTKSARVALLGALVIALGLTLFSRWVLSFFGRAFVDGSPVLRILSLGWLIDVGMGPVGLLLNMTGYEKETAKCVAIALTINVALSVLLTSLLQSEGAAIAYTTSTAICNILLHILVYKKLDIIASPLYFGKNKLKS